MTDDGAPGRRWALPPNLLLALLFLACSVVSVAVLMDKYPYPSPIDEVVHYDFIHDAPHVPVIGEKISQSAMHEWACRTSGPEYVLPLPPCRPGPYDPAAFPGAGASTAGGSGPVYYYVTAVFARPVAAVTGWSLFSVARGFGAVWLAALMMVSYLIAERLGASRLAGAGAAILVGTGSSAITSAGTMGPDTTTAVMSGLVMLAVLSYDGTRRRAGWFLVAVALAALTKFTAFEAVGAAVLYLVVLPLLSRRREERESGGRAREASPPLRASLLTAGAGLATFAVVSFLWGLRLNLTATEEPEASPLYDMLHAESHRLEQHRRAPPLRLLQPGHRELAAGVLQRPDQQLRGCGDRRPAERGRDRRRSRAPLGTAAQRFRHRRAGADGRGTVHAGGAQLLRQPPVLHALSAPRVRPSGRTDSLPGDDLPRSRAEPGAGAAGRVVDGQRADVTPAQRETPRSVVRRTQVMRAALAGLAVAGLVVVGRLTGALEGVAGLALAALVVALAPVSRQLSRRLLIGGGLVLGWVPLLGGCPRPGTAWAG